MVTGQECSAMPDLRFSFVIPTHDRPQQVSHAVAGVLAQTRPPDEVVVVDDGSQPAVALDLSTPAPNVVVLRQANTGPATARNAGARRATGDVLVFVDDDDALDLHWLAKMATPLEADPAVAVVCCGATLQRTDTGARRDSPVRAMGQLYRGVRGNFDTGTYAVRRDLFLEVGGFADGLASGEHHELAIRLIDVITARGGRIAAIDEPLVTIHQRPSVLRSSNQPRRMYDSAIYMLEHHGAAMAPSARATYLAIAAVNAARLDDFGRARRLLRQALRANRTRWTNYGRLVLATVRPLGRRVWKVHEWQGT
jgi:glycosyltransferase involved in cell wall biosynthesis